MQTDRTPVKPTGAIVQTGHRHALAQRERLEERLVTSWLVGFGSDSTRRAYLADVRDWRAWLAAHDAPGLLAVERVHVDLYARDLEAQGRAPSTVARRLAALASLYGYACREGVLDRSPVDHVKRPRVSGESPRLGIERADYAALLAAARDDGPRSWALVALLGLLGLRVSEATGLDVEDLGLERGAVTVALTRKGAKRDTVGMPEAAAVAVLAAKGDRTTGPLLATRTGARLDRRAAARTLERLARRAGLDRAPCPHDLRHGFVTSALEAGVDLHVVQEAAGHADPRTTTRYNRRRQLVENPAAAAVAAALG
jgi:integrase/recombinase XerD